MSALTIEVNGLDRTCDTVPELKVVTGRHTVTDAGEAGYAAIMVEGEPLPGVAQVCTVSAEGRPRHIGWSTDRNLDHPYGPVELTPLSRITSMGALSRWGRVLVGDTPWPQESVSARAKRIAAIVGTPITVQGGHQEVIPRDVDRKRAIDLLEELAKSTGGWLFDHPGMGVVLQALDARRQTPTYATWADEPPAATWADAEGTWAQDTGPASMAPITLDCNQTLWEPTWAQSTAPLASTVRVVWGSPEQEVVRTDPAAETLLGGPVELVVKTTLALESDAIELATLVLRRVTTPRDGLSSLRVHWADLDPETAARLTMATPGTRVTVLGLPQPAPATMFQGIIEGWEDVWTGPDERITTLWLSDTNHSWVLPTWADEPPGATWSQLDPTLTWEADI
jgi:hypothetical protein